MRLLPVRGGTSVLGSARFYPEERPVRSVQVAPFHLARGPVTVAQFGRFVSATGHVTVAERDGSSVFRPPRRPVPLHDPSAWWSWVPGACWHAPAGPGSRPRHPDEPVVHVTMADASAFCAWAGLRLPTEVEWEHAARQCFPAEDYAWGPERAPGGRVPAHVWHGAFPWLPAEHWCGGPVPVGDHPGVGSGLLDLIGNVWELVDTLWSVPAGEPPGGGGPPAPSASRAAGSPCCGPVARTGGLTVAKGGSFLCSEQYCLRYRPAARIAVAGDSPSGHVGFRCAA